ncbi:MAG: zinc ribbon domain-containing protein [Anaerolineales bacterium]|nr:zinc ribbon domain-containing protein [Chloroflexota bacterium]MBL6983572.1 zinc ribbon domain-containing protein [Anaerolineales bacterium]
MPIFEFVCEECDQFFEELVRSASAIGEVICPGCQSESVQKKLSTFASKVAGSSSFSPSTSVPSCSPGGL